MEAHAPAFDRGEYRRRLERVRERMCDRGLDALYVTDPANLNYLTGYDSWSFYVHQGVLLGRDAGPVWVGRRMDLTAARATTWLEESALRPYGDEYVQAAGDRHPADVVAAVAADLGLEEATLGVETSAPYYTAETHRNLERALSSARLADSTLLVNRVRLRKSAAELERMREAAEITGRAMRAGLSRVGPGVRESDVAADVWHRLVAGTDEFAGEYPAIAPLLPSGGTTGSPHLPWTGRRLAEGDPVVLELSGCRCRYHAPLTRMAWIGDPPSAVRERFDAVVAGLEAAIDAVEPGVTATAVTRTFERTIGRHGIEKESRLGYPVGLGYPPDWGERTVSIRAGEETVLEEGMTFHLIPGLWGEDPTVVCSETVAVTANGAETLCDLPRELH